MASAAITVVGNCATIESDTNEAVITNGTSTLVAQTGETIRRPFDGELRNHGPADVWLKVSIIDATPAATVVTSGAQAQYQVPLPAGSSIPIGKIYYSIAHKTAASTATLSWVPKSSYER